MKAVDGPQLGAAPGAEVQPSPAAPHPPRPKDFHEGFDVVGAEAAQAEDPEFSTTQTFHPTANGILSTAHDDSQDCESDFSLGRYIVNGDTYAAVKIIRVPSEDFRGDISKEQMTKMNLKLATTNGSDTPYNKISDEETISNGILTDEQSQNLSSIIQTRRKIQASKDAFDIKNDDDYVMITLPGDNVSSFETSYVNGNHFHGNLVDSNTVNINATETDCKNSFTNGIDSSVTQEKSKERCEVTRGVECRSSDDKFEMKKNNCNAVQQTLNTKSKENATTSMPDVICSSDTFNESNNTKKIDRITKAPSVNCDVPVVNGYIDEVDHSKVSADTLFSGSDSPTSQWDRAVSEVKEQAIARLQAELHKAHQELKLRDEEVTRLSRIRQEVEGELEELTASLFQEAHNMVRAANVKQAAAERSLKESEMQVEVLIAEVSALKTLVLTSTPSRPNPHLHPQIDPRASRSKDDATPTGVGLFNKKHRRSPSHYNLKYGRENSPPESPVKEQQVVMPEPQDNKDGWEVDPNIHREFVAWKQNSKIDKSDPFIARIYNEDINLCLDFPNVELSAKVAEAVEAGNIFIEAVSDKSKMVFPKKCALLETPRQCHYRMKLGDQEQWHYISQICRNRIIAVCDFLNYLRYIERGLVKSSVHDIYWEITRLRKEMVLARLGLALSS